MNEADVGSVQNPSVLPTKTACLGTKMAILMQKLFQTEWSKVFMPCKTPCFGLHVRHHHMTSPVKMTFILY